jgi:hypothetical protein
MNYIKAEKNVIPASATLAEASYYVLESIERDYNDLMRGLALNELGVLEATGSEVVYEGDVLTEATEKVASFTEKNYGKVKGMYEKFLTDQKSKVDSLKSKIPDKTKKVVAANISGIADKEYAKSYSYANLESAKSGTANNKIWKGVAFLQSSAATVSDANIEEVKSKFANIIGASSSSIKDVKGAAINYLRGSEKSFSITKSTVVSNMDSMWKSVFDYKTISSELKGCLNTTKSAFAGLSKSTKVGGDDAVSKARIKFQKYAAEAIVALNNAILLVYKEQLDTNRKVVWKAAAQCLKNSPKKVEKTPVKEEADWTAREVAEFAKAYCEASDIEITDQAILAMNEAGVDVSDILPVTEETEKFDSLFDFDLDD